MAKKRITAAFILVAATSVLWPVPGARADDCSATVEGTLTRVEPDGDITRLVFDVEISTQSECAKITYDVLLEIRQEDGTIEKEKLGRYVKLLDGSISELVRHELGSGQSLVSWEANLDSCTRCDQGGASETLDGELPGQTHEQVQCTRLAGRPDELHQILTPADASLQEG